MKKKSRKPYEGLDRFQLIVNALSILNDRDGFEFYSIQLHEDGSGTLLYGNRIRTVFMSRHATLMWAYEVTKYGSSRNEHHGA